MIFWFSFGLATSTVSGRVLHISAVQTARETSFFILESTQGLHTSGLYPKEDKFSGFSWKTFLKSKEQKNQIRKQSVAGVGLFPGLLKPKCPLRYRET